MDNRTELQIRNDISRLLAKSYDDSMKKMSYISSCVGRSSSTINSWMRGTSSPKIRECFKFFDAIGINILRDSIEMLWPDVYDKISYLDSDERIDKALHHFIDNVMPYGRKKLLYILDEDYGVDPTYTINLFSLHFHSDMRSRISAANTIKIKYEYDDITGNLINEDITPASMVYLDHATSLAQISVANKNKGYTTNMMVTFDVARIIREARSKANKSIMDVAHELGVSRTTISNWESGQSEPTVYQFVMFFKYLDLNLFDYIVNTKEEVSETDVIRLHECINKLPIGDKRLLLYMMIGEHGSSWFPTLELMVAHCHLNLKSQMENAKLIVTNYDICKSIGSTVLSEHKMPDEELVNSKIREIEKLYEQKNKGAN